MITVNEDSDDEFEILDEAPQHLRIVTNENHPIEVPDDDDEDDEDDDEEQILIRRADTAHTSRSKRPRPLSSAVSDEDDDTQPGSSINGKRWRSSIDPEQDLSLEEFNFIHDNDAARPPIAGPSSSRSHASSSSQPVLDEPLIVIPPERTAANLLSLVLEVIPDVDQVWITSLLVDQVVAGNVEGAASHVIEVALDMVNYPRSGSFSKGKGKAAPDPEYSDIDYRKEQRWGMTYLTKSQVALEEYFPNVPTPYIRSVFLNEGKNLLVPAYNTLKRYTELAEKPYTELRRPRLSKGKAKESSETYSSRIANSLTGLYNPDATSSTAGAELGALEFDLEKAYLDILIERKQRVAQDTATKEKREAEEAAAKETERQVAIEKGLGIVCGCCFTEEAPQFTFQCPGGHSFCETCVSRVAENKLGEQQHIITCMDQSGCKLEFSERELGRALSVKTMELYHRLKQQHELQAAQIEGLESCPFCPYMLEILNQEEKLFRCLRPDCMKVSCRKCKHEDHIPKTCEEAAADRKLDNRHAVEEAMSEALMRKCPKCKKPYIKESGCNKITCQTCRTVSCYLCQKAIPEGYAHFERTSATQTNKCILWDQNEAAGDRERIRLARDGMQAQIRAAAEGGEAVAAEDLHVTLPAAPPGQGPAAMPHILQPLPGPPAAEFFFGQQHALPFGVPPVPGPPLFVGGHADQPLWNGLPPPPLPQPVGVAGVADGLLHKPPEHGLPRMRVAQLVDHLAPAVPDRQRPRPPIMPPPHFLAHQPHVHAARLPMVGDEREINAGHRYGRHAMHRAPANPVGPFLPFVENDVFYKGDAIRAAQAGAADALRAMQAVRAQVDAQIRQGRMVAHMQQVRNNGLMLFQEPIGHVPLPPDEQFLDMVYPRLPFDPPPPPPNPRA